MAFPFVSRLFSRPAKPQQTRRFDGGAAGGGRRGFGMGGTFGRVNSEVSASGGATLRSRARYLANNNPWLSQAVANWAGGALVGSGIVPTPKHPPDATTRADVTAAFQAGRMTRTPMAARTSGGACKPMWRAGW